MKRTARSLIVFSVLVLLLSGLAAALVSRPTGQLPPPLAGVARLSRHLWAHPYAARAKLPGFVEPERRAVETLGRQIDGLVVWSSNRSGNHELYLLDLARQSIRQLTHDPNVDFFARFAPDGRRILFLRSQREGVSARDKSAWDLMLVSVDGKREERLARGAYHPTWVADGSGILFERGTQFVLLTLTSRQERVLLDVAATLPGVE